jgi:hypothetical protein
LGGGGGIGTVFSRGGTGVCFSLVEGGGGGLEFVYSYGGTNILFFFSTTDFFFIPDLGGTMAPAGPPIDPSLFLANNQVINQMPLKSATISMPLNLIFFVVGTIDGAPILPILSSCLLGM